MDEWIDEMWSVLTMSYYSALKRKEVLTEATTQMNLEDKMLRERSQSQKTNTVGMHFWEVPGAVRFMETGSSMGATRGWGRGSGELFTGDRVAAPQDARDSLHNVNTLSTAKLRT